MTRIYQYVIPVFRMLLGLGLLVYLLDSGMVDGTLLVGMIQMWPLSIAALLCVFEAICLASWRLCLLMRPHNLHLSYVASLKLMLVGLFFNTFLPGAIGGDVVRIYYATKDKPGRRIEITMIFLLDRILGIFGILCLALLLALFFTELIASQPILRGFMWVSVLGIVALSIVMLLGRSQRVSESRIITWLARKLLRDDFINRFIITMRTACLHPRSFFAGLGLTIMVHLLITTGTLLLVQATNDNGASWSMALLIPFGFIANALPVTPGGLGVGEAAFDQLFQLLGFTGGAIALLGWRVLMLLIGLPGLAIYMFDKREVMAPQAVPPPL